MSIIARFTVIAGIWILFSEMAHPQWIPAEFMVNTATPYVSGAADAEPFIIRKIACTADQGKTCQKVSETCGSACKKYLSKAYQDCMDICSCNYYHCKTACGDKANMPPSCRQ
jgi:hypothetical protein